MIASSLGSAAHLTELTRNNVDTCAKTFDLIMWRSALSWIENPADNIAFNPTPRPMVVITISDFLSSSFKNRKFVSPLATSEMTQVETSIGPTSLCGEKQKCKKSSDDDM